MPNVPMSPEAALAWATTALDDTDLRTGEARSREYYNGKQDLSFATPKFQSAFGRLFTAFAYNRCGAVVDAHAERLFVESFSLPGQTSHDSDLARQVAAIWQGNRMDRRQNEVHTEALCMGNGYVIVWPHPEDASRPVIWPQKAEEMRVRYSDEEPGLVSLATKGWKQEDGRVRINVYGPDRIDRWVTERKRAATDRLSPRQFVPFAEDAAGETVANPYGEVPVIHFANNARTGALGVSELRDIIPIQDALNKALADMMVAQEFASFPQKVIIGIDVDAALNPYAGQGEDALARKEMLQKFATGVDRILTLADPAAKIGEFSSVALQQFRDVAESWDTRISRVAKVPVHYLTLTGDFPSGRALRTAEAPFVAKLENRQRSFGNSWEDVVRLALRIAGRAYDDAIDAVWRSAAPMAEEDSWDIVLQQVSAGVPLELAVEAEMGWAPDQVERLTLLRDEATARAAEAFQGTAGVDGTDGEGGIA